jgi:hypothetical protein
MNTDLSIKKNNSDYGSSQINDDVSTTELI